MSQQENEKKAQVFSKRLTGARNLKFLTQSQLAEAVDASLRSVQNWEDGKHIPHGKTLRNLCEVLGVSPDYLFGEEPDYGRGASPPHILTEDRERPPPQVKPDSAQTVRAESHVYLDRVLDACEGRLRQLIWTVEELKRHFPVNSLPPSDAQSVAKRAAAGEKDKHHGT